MPQVGVAMTTHPLYHAHLGSGDGGCPPVPPPDVLARPPQALPDILACLHEATPEDVAKYRSMILAVSYGQERVLVVTRDLSTLGPTCTLSFLLVSGVHFDRG